MSLHEDVWNNTLTGEKLRRWYESGGVDSIGGPKAITPLAAACLQGHLEAVRVLLEGGADPNAPSPLNRTPLFYATSQSPPTNRAAIVRALLDNGADIDASSTEDCHNTPLMIALVETRDADVVRELVSRGASLSARNSKGETVQELAVQVGMVQDIQPRADRVSDEGDTELGHPENIKRLTTLSLYQSVIYSDDSSSMDRQNRFDKQRHLVSRIVHVASKFLPDDNQEMPLRFINSDNLSSYTSSRIDHALQSLRPSKGTRIGTNLRNKILNPLVYDVLNRPSGGLQRPILVCAITDGVPDGEDKDTFRTEIAKCREFLVSKGYEPSTVTFLICQIGDDPEAKGFLDGLRDDDIQDVLYLTTDRLDEEFEQLHTNEKMLEVWLLNLLTKPIMEGYGI